MKAFKAGKAPAQKRVQNGSCGQNIFASEDQRLWTEGRKIIALGFFHFHPWKSNSRAGAIPDLRYRKELHQERNGLQIDYILHSKSINERNLLDTETKTKTNIIAVSVVNF